jgi:hypothetical protein
VTYVVVLPVVPVRQEHWAEIEVPIKSAVKRVRAVDNHWPKQATGVLSRVMGVPPRGAIEIGTEAIGERAARGDGALLDRGNTAVLQMS